MYVEGGDYMCAICAFQCISHPVEHSSRETCSTSYLRLLSPAIVQVKVRYLTNSFIVLWVVFIFVFLDLVGALCGNLGAHANNTISFVSP